MLAILPLLAPGAFSWLSEASCWSRSWMMLAAMATSSLSPSQVYATNAPGGGYAETLR